MNNLIELFTKQKQVLILTKPTQMKVLLSLYKGINFSKQYRIEKLIGRKNYVRQLTFNKNGTLIKFEKITERVSRRDDSIVKSKTKSFVRGKGLRLSIQPRKKSRFKSFVRDKKTRLSFQSRKKSKTKSFVRDKGRSRLRKRKTLKQKFKVEKGRVKELKRIEIRKGLRIVVEYDGIKKSKNVVFVLGKGRKIKITRQSWNSLGSATQTTIINKLRRARLLDVKILGKERRIMGTIKGTKTEILFPRKLELKIKNEMSKTKRSGGKKWKSVKGATQTSLQALISREANVRGSGQFTDADWGRLNVAQRNQRIVGLVNHVRTSVRNYNPSFSLNYKGGKSFELTITIRKSLDSSSVRVLGASLPRFIQSSAIKERVRNVVIPKVRLNFRYREESKYRRILIPINLRKGKITRIKFPVPRIKTPPVKRRLRKTGKIRKGKKITRKSSAKQKGYYVYVGGKRILKNPYSLKDSLDYVSRILIANKIKGAVVKYGGTFRVLGRTNARHKGHYAKHKRFFTTGRRGNNVLIRKKAISKVRMKRIVGRKRRR